MLILPKIILTLYRIGFQFTYIRVRLKDSTCNLFLHAFINTLFELCAIIFPYQYHQITEASLESSPGEFD